MSAMLEHFQPLAMRRVSADRAAASRALGHGLKLKFSVAGTPASLVIEALPRHLAQQPPGAAIQSDLGVLWLTDASAVLSLLGDTPVVLDGEPQSWYWQLFNQGLNATVRNLLGELRPLSAELSPVDDHFDCRLTIVRGEERLVAQLSASSASLLQLFSHTALSPSLAPPPRHWPLALPVVLGDVSLGMGTLRSLRLGDVLLIPEARFDCTGYGELVLGPWRCRGELSSETDAVYFTVHDLEEQPMNDYDQPPESVGSATGWDAPDEDDYEAQEYDEYDKQAENEDEHDGPVDELNDGLDEAADDSAALSNTFADLPLALTVRSGSLRLTMKQLQRLAPGTVLEIPDVKPGAATLYYGERAVAEGELVEVDGRLGLQILRMELV